MLFLEVTISFEIGGVPVVARGMWPTARVIGRAESDELWGNVQAAILSFMGRHAPAAEGRWPLQHALRLVRLLPPVCDKVMEHYRSMPPYYADQFRKMRPVAPGAEGGANGQA